MVKSRRINTPTDLIQFAVIGIVIVWAVSLVIIPLAALFNIVIPKITLGSVFLIILATNILLILATVAPKVTDLKQNDFIVLFIAIGVNAALFIYLPDIFPDIFSIFKSGVFSVVSP